MECISTNFYTLTSMPVSLFLFYFLVIFWSRNIHPFNAVTQLKSTPDQDGEYFNLKTKDHRQELITLVLSSTTSYTCKFWLLHI
jgi:hypothetical protein